MWSASGTWSKFGWWLWSWQENSLRIQAVAKVTELSISSRQPGNHNMPCGKADRSAQESKKPLNRGFWNHRRGTPDCLQGCLLSLISGPLCARGKCLACSEKAASALSWAPETNHWHPKHTTDAWMAGFTWCQWAGPNTDLVCSKGWGQHGHSASTQAVSPRTPIPVRFGISCTELGRTSNNWALLKL